MTDEEFSAMVDVYKKFYYDEISREEAKEHIGDDWEEVSQIATMQICREEQDMPGVSELVEAYGRQEQNAGCSNYGKREDHHVEGYLSRHFDNTVEIWCPSIDETKVVLGHEYINNCPMCGDEIGFESIYF